MSAESNNFYFYFHSYYSDQFPQRVNAFSSSLLTFQGQPIGDAYNEVRPMLIRNAYAMACLGDESNYCASSAAGAEADEESG